MTAEEMIKSFVEDTPACNLKPNRRWATRWRHEWLYSCKKVNQSGVYYEYNDPVMVKARWSFHHEYMLKYNLHYEISMTYDETWSQNRRGRRMKWHKARAFVGSRRKSFVSKKMSRALTNIPGPHIERPLALMDDASHAVKTQRQMCQHEDTMNDPIQYMKEGITVILSFFLSGHRGPIGICCHEGKVPHDLMEEINKNYIGVARVLSSTTERTHFVNGSVIAELYRDLYGPVPLPYIDFLR